jgi:hypothetical protein
VVDNTNRGMYMSDEYVLVTVAVSAVAVDSDDGRVLPTIDDCDAEPGVISRERAIVVPSNDDHSRKPRQSL